jgi:hypothetical protein
MEEEENEEHEEEEEKKAEVSESHTIVRAFCRNTSAHVHCRVGLNDRSS